jgi:hypothetical protein
MRNAFIFTSIVVVAIILVAGHYHPYAYLIFIVVGPMIYWGFADDEIYPVTGAPPFSNASGLSTS